MDIDDALDQLEAAENPRSRRYQQGHPDRPFPVAPSVPQSNPHLYYQQPGSGGRPQQNGHYASENHQQQGQGNSSNNNNNMMFTRLSSFEKILDELESSSDFAPASYGLHQAAALPTFQELAASSSSSNNHHHVHRSVHPPPPPSLPRPSQTSIISRSDDGGGGDVQQPQESSKEGYHHSTAANSNFHNNTNNFGHPTHHQLPVIESRAADSTTNITHSNNTNELIQAALSALPSYDPAALDNEFRAAASTTTTTNNFLPNTSSNNESSHPTATTALAPSFPPPTDPSVEKNNNNNTDRRNPAAEAHTQHHLPYYGGYQPNYSDYGTAVLSEEKRTAVPSHPPPPYDASTTEFTITNNQETGVEAASTIYLPDLLSSAAKTVDQNKHPHQASFEEMIVTDFSCSVRTDSNGSSRVPNHREDSTETDASSEIAREAFDVTENDLSGSISVVDSAPGTPTSAGISIRRTGINETAQVGQDAAALDVVDANKRLLFNNCEEQQQTEADEEQIEIAIPATDVSTDERSIMENMVEISIVGGPPRMLSNNNDAPPTVIPDNTTNSLAENYVGRKMSAQETSEIFAEQVTNVLMKEIMDGAAANSAAAATATEDLERSKVHAGSEARDRNAYESIPPYSTATDMMADPSLDDAQQKNEHVSSGGPSRVEITTFAEEPLSESAVADPNDWNMTASNKPVGFNLAAVESTTENGPILSHQHHDQQQSDGDISDSELEKYLLDDENDGNDLHQEEVMLSGNDGQSNDDSSCAATATRVKELLTSDSGQNCTNETNATTARAGQTINAGDKPTASGGEAVERMVEKAAGTAANDLVTSVFDDLVDTVNSVFDAPVESPGDSTTFSGLFTERLELIDADSDHQTTSGDVIAPALPVNAAARETGAIPKTTNHPSSILNPPAAASNQSLSPQQLNSSSSFGLTARTNDDSNPIGTALENVCAAKSVSINGLSQQMHNNNNTNSIASSSANNTDNIHSTPSASSSSSSSNQASSAALVYSTVESNSPFGGNLRAVHRSDSAEFEVRIASDNEDDEDEGDYAEIDYNDNCCVVDPPQIHNSETNEVADEAEGNGAEELNDAAEIKDSSSKEPSSAYEEGGNDNPKQPTTSESTASFSDEGPSSTTAAETSDGKEENDLPVEALPRHVVDSESSVVSSSSQPPLAESSTDLPSSAVSSINEVSNAEADSGCLEVAAETATVGNDANVNGAPKQGPEEEQYFSAEESAALHALDQAVAAADDNSPADDNDHEESTTDVVYATSLAETDQQPENEIIHEVAEVDQQPATSSQDTGHEQEGAVGGQAEVESEVEISAPERPSVIASTHIFGPTLESFRLTESELTLGKIKPNWIPDGDAPNCMLCQSKFSFVIRRHHCRACGRVLCDKCCNKKAALDYMQTTPATNNSPPANQRVCEPCFNTLKRIKDFEAEAAVVEQQRLDMALSFSEVDGAGENRGDLTASSAANDQLSSSHRGLLRPIGSAGNNGRSVTFSDGVRPGDSLQNESSEGAAAAAAGSSEASTTTGTSASNPSPTTASLPALPAEPSSPSSSSGGGSSSSRSSSRRSSRQGGSRRSRAALASQSELESFLPKQSARPNDGDLATFDWPFIVSEGLRHNGNPEQLLKQIEDPDQPPVEFAIKRNLTANVKIIKLTCCVGSEVWCIGSQGLRCVAQDEIVILLKRLPGEVRPPFDVLRVFNALYEEALQGSRVSEMEHTVVGAISGLHFGPEGFLGSTDHAGFLYIRPNLQCLRKLPVPDKPYLVGLLITRSEVPWAKVLPMRLLFRLGAEFKVYPCPLVSERFRRPLFEDIGHTIMNLLADFRNYSYSLPWVQGSRVHLEDGKTTLWIPKSKQRMLNKIMAGSQQPSVLAWAADICTDADSLLVAIQDITRGEDGAVTGNEYTSQIVNIQGQERKITGATFVVINGALRSNNVGDAKTSIVEDGYMIQIRQDEMEKLVKKLKAGEDYQISVPGDQPMIVDIKWTDKGSTNKNRGYRSPIDGRKLEGLPCLKVSGKIADHSGGHAPMGHLIRMTELFVIDTDIPLEKLEELQGELLSLGRHITSASSKALLPYTSELAQTGLRAVGIRVTLGSELVEFTSGAGGQNLPDPLMPALDSELVPLLYTKASGQTHLISVEIILRVLDL